jgi:hypothetical protein
LYDRYLLLHIIGILDIQGTEKKLKINEIGFNVSEFCLESLRFIFLFISGLEVDLEMELHGWSK